MNSPNTGLEERQGTLAGKFENELVAAQDSGSDDFKDGNVMVHMGKKQQLQRNFGFFTILGFSAVLLASWEASCASFAAGLFNGGPAALVYGMMFTLSGYMAMALSLAEMASICPIAGAQYHWTAMFAPPRYAAFLTWMQGWITVFAWQATATSVSFITATQMQGLIVLNNPNYDFQRWHGTLMMWAQMAVTFAINVYGIKLLPMFEFFGGILHVVLFFAIIIPVLVLSPKSSSEFVWASFINEGGYSSDGISWCIGLLTVTWCFVGFDGAIHMSEEVRNSAVVIPKILIWTIVINGVMAFSFMIAILYSIGNVEDALSTPTGYPIIEIFYQATGSIKAATAMESGIVVIAFFSTCGCLGSVSRLTWAFARDEGLPFSKFFSHVNPHYHVPIRAIGLVTAVVMLLSLINIGSSLALNAILSLATLALYISYLIPITLLLIKRLRKEPITFGPFNLGRFGFLVNLYSIIYNIFISIFLPWPGSVPVTASTMNYSGPVFGAILMFALADWTFRGRKSFKGPRREVSETDATPSTILQKSR